MEVALDDISNGMWEKNAYLQAFYFDGLDGDIGLHTKVVEREDEIDPRAVCGVPLGKTSDGEAVYARYARSPYVECREDTAGVPEDLPLDQLTVDKALEYINAPPDRELGIDPETGLPIVAKQGRFGAYVSLGRFPQWPKASSREGKLFRLPHHLKLTKIAMAYLKLAISVENDDAVLRVINSPKRGIGKSSLDKAKTFAESNNSSLFDALEQVEKLEIKGTALKGIKGFTDFCRSISTFDSPTPADLLNQIFETSGYRKEILSSKNSETQMKIFEELSEVLKEFETTEQVIAEVERFEELKQQPKPKTSSLFDTMTLERVTFEDALQLLSLPRTVGVDPADGQEITVQNGPYGPYLKKGSDTRNIATEEELLTISLEQCLDSLAQPKKFGRRAAKPPLKELGVDPVTEKPILLKEGQWGPYVTDGKTNASLQLGDSVEELTDERAVELLAERRAKV